MERNISCNGMSWADQWDTFEEPPPSEPPPSSAKEATNGKNKASKCSASGRMKKAKHGTLAGVRWVKALCQRKSHK
uniref:Uncharacterized protein n=1 Tax=Nymphaea colorata TaxID=210225 RepID=A0A5K1BAG3_9MAGN